MLIENFKPGDPYAKHIRYCSGDNVLVLNADLFFAAGKATAILGKKNPKKDVSLCNCGATTLLAEAYGASLSYCSLGSADTMFRAAKAGKLGPWKVSPISKADIVDVVNLAQPILVFGSWYGQSQRCGHVNVIIGYEQVAQGTPGFRELVSYDAGGTGDRCKRCLIMTNYCWKSSDWNECKFFKIDGYEHE